MDYISIRKIYKNIDKLKLKKKMSARTLTQRRIAADGNCDFVADFFIFQLILLKKKIKYYYLLFITLKINRV